MPTSKNQAIDIALKGDWTKALEINEMLLKEDPNDVEALNRIGLAYTVLGKHDKAKKAYQKVLEIDSLNSIALKNIKKFSKNSKKAAIDLNFRVNNIFLEEKGKTKIVELINLAQSEVLITLRTGRSVELTVKRLKVFVTHQDKKYIGVLPDDIGKRLIKFIKGGNKYEAFIRSAGSNSVTVFIRELKRALRFKDHPSFLISFEKPLLKKIKHKTQDVEKESSDNDQETYSEEEES